MHGRQALAGGEDSHYSMIMMLKWLMVSLENPDANMLPPTDGLARAGSAGSLGGEQDKPRAPDPGLLQAALQQMAQQPRAAPLVGGVGILRGEALEALVADKADVLVREAESAPRQALIEPLLPFCLLACVRACQPPCVCVPVVECWRPNSRSTLLQA